MAAQNTTAQSRQVTCAFGESVKSGNIKPFAFQSIRGFAGWIKGLAPVKEKIDSAYIVGATFSGAQRTLLTMTGATMIQLDFDKPVSPEHQTAVSAVLEGLGIAHVTFDTFSNGGKFVALVPLARPATAAEHKATLDFLVSELGVYAAGLDQASYSPVLPRFVSPNAANQQRTINLREGAFLEPVASGEADPLPQNVTRIAPIPARPAVADRFALYADQASPEEKQIFLFALRNNLLRQSRLEEYPQWFPVIYAAFRAWAINSTKLTEEQQEMWETLDAWSKLHPKWKPDALKVKLTDWLRDRGAGAQSLHIQSLISHEINPAALREAVRTDMTLDFDAQIDLLTTINKVLGAPDVTVVPDEVLAAAVTQMKAQDEAHAKLSLRGLTFLARAPKINARFDEFITLLTSFTTQNKAEPWELTEDSWDYFLRPAPVLVGLCQMYAMGFAPHVMFRLSAAIQPKALNVYFMNIAPPGTGKSETMNIIHNVLSKTVFKNLSPSYKLHSATGLWINAFEKHGALQLVVSDEAESLIGKQNQKDQHLLALQTSVKQLYDAGIPGRKFRPSAQVQRELREIAAPVMSLNLAATPALLREDIGTAMLNDGFVSRMIVSIDDRPDKNETFDESVDRKVALIGTVVNDTLEHTVAAAAKFFNDSWRSGPAAHPAGREFFSFIGDEDSDTLADNINAHFERTDMPVRFITPPKNPAGTRKFAQIMTRAVNCWEVPAGLRGTDAQSNIDSLRVRSETKVCVLSAILTLVADPAATEVDLRIMEWVADILYTTQHPFYRYLLNASDTGMSMLKHRANPSFIDKLMPALNPGGPLRNGPVKSNDLRNFSKAWRKLIGDLKLPETSDRGKLAREVLSEIEVGYRKVGTNGMEFYMTKGLPDAS